MGNMLAERQKLSESIKVIGRMEQFDQGGSCRIPLYFYGIRAGFPSPADDYVVEEIDLNKYLMRHPTASFLLRVAGNSMVDIGINPNDILVVDRSLTAQNGKMIVAVINGELVVRKLMKKADGLFLIPGNQNDRVIKIDEGLDNMMWGVVTNVIHQL